MRRQILAIFTIFTVILGCSGNDGSSEIKIDSKTPAKQLTAYSLGVQYAKGMGDLNLDQKAQAHFLKGVQDSFQNTVQLDNNDIQVHAKKADSTRQENRTKQAASEREKGQLALKELMAQDSDIELHSSGLAYKIIEQGSFIENPKSSAFVGLSYESSHLDGKVYESTLNGNPRLLPLRGVFKAWQIAFELAGAGGKIMIISPPELTYGNNGALPYVAPGEYLKFNLNFSKYYGTKPEGN